MTVTTWPVGFSGEVRVDTAELDRVFGVMFVALFLCGCFFALCDCLLAFCHSSSVALRDDIQDATTTTGL